MRVILFLDLFFSPFLLYSSEEQTSDRLRVELCRIF